MDVSKNYLKLFYFLGGFLLLGVGFLGWVYYSFYKNVKKSKDSIVRYTFEHGPLANPIGNNDYVSTWGAFGDLVGGTFNPFVGLLSIILLFATWWLTKETLEITRTELAQSTEAFKKSAEAQNEIQKTQSIQQFDTIFFSMIQNLNHVFNDLKAPNKDTGESELDKCYRLCFGEKSYTLLERQHFIDDSHEMRKYFIILYQIIKNIKYHIYNNKNFTQKEREKLARLYSNMLRSNLDNKVLQLLLINIYKRFSNYSMLIREFRIFEHMDFRDALSLERYWNFVVLQVTVELGSQYFFSSDWYKDLSKNIVIGKVFQWYGSDFYTQNLFAKKYLQDYLNKRIRIYFEKSQVVINIHTDSIDRSKLRFGFKQDENRYLSSDINIYRDKFLLKKDDLYYQLIVDKNEIKVLTSEDKLKNYCPIDQHKISIE